MTKPKHNLQAKGYRFPGEFETHEATWLSWPHNPATWPGKLKQIEPVYAQFAALISRDEAVHINVSNSDMEAYAKKLILMQGGVEEHLFFHYFPTNDAWCRDHGPCILVSNQNVQEPVEQLPSRVLLNWEYNAWGGKYPPFDKDQKIPSFISDYLGLEMYSPGIVMEGGAIETNGQGVIMTTTSCLLNPNRNPDFSKSEIESFLRHYYGAEQVWWLGDGIEGDDTDGHIDDMTRFVSPSTIVSVLEENSSDVNYKPLLENWELLQDFRFKNGSTPEIIALPMPAPVYYDGQRLPASYANFYITNHSVIVPVFSDDNDSKALGILQELFPTRKVVGIESTDLIWGLGAFHCLSQQIPKAP
jgi:agmatine deiminase